ncbi:hypothetical protein C4J83_1397 [Pseudomonas sp. LBUM920]|nr:hypothetical protein C4J83_1397 [Pseudomonas sp. LBUM920]
MWLPAPLWELACLRLHQLSSPAEPSRLHRRKASSHMD